MKTAGHIITMAVLALVSLMTMAGCSDQDYFAGGGDGSPVNLRLLVPAVSRAAAETSDTSPVLEAEGKIHSLWFYAFPVGGEGERMVRKLNPKDSESGYTENALYDDKYYQYTFNLQSGRYHFYVIANYDGLTGNESEGQLEGMTIQYKVSDTEINLPSLDEGLPMIYVNKGTDEKGVEIQAATKENPVELTADMEFTCAKVSYTLKFDNSADGVDAVLRGKGLKITNIEVKRISNYTTLVDTEPKDVEAEITNRRTLNDSEVMTTNGDVKGTFYLPERYLSSEDKATEEQTVMEISGDVYNAEGTQATGEKVHYSVLLGGSACEEGKDRTDLHRLCRATHYDMTCQLKSAGDVTNLSVTLEDWTPLRLLVELGGPYYLEVSETSVAVEGGKATTVRYLTDVPKLSFESPTIEVNNEDIPLFVMTDRPAGDGSPENSCFDININPAIPYGTKGIPTESYIYVIAGELKKKIDITPIKFEPYLIVTPLSHEIYIRDLVSQNEMRFCSVEFAYRTNLPSVTVGVGTYKNEHLTIDTGNLVNGVGTVTCTLTWKTPATLREYFPTQFTVPFTYTATDNGNNTLTAESELTIIPYATTYTLHFRPVTDDWNNPHIYVYEPLYTPEGNAVTLAQAGNDATTKGENAIQYGFTGKITFLGWSTQGGSVGSLGNNYEDVDRGLYDPLNINKSIYNINIDYCSDYRKDGYCAQCNSGSVNRKWPGVQMKKDPDNPGWYKFDLPALAQPGKALIMFADAHDSKTELTVKTRYPAHMVPGVPLYDFADKDGWFYYDYTKGDQNEFVDDKPSVADLKVWRIWVIYADYANYQYAYIWDDSKQEPVGAWPGTTMSVDENGHKYIDIPSPEKYTFNSGVHIIFNNNNGDNIPANKTADLLIPLNNFQDADPGLPYQKEVAVESAL